MKLILFVYLTVCFSVFSQVNKTDEILISLSAPHNTLNTASSHYYSKDGVLIAFKVHGNACHFQKFEGNNLSETLRAEGDRLPESFRFQGFIDFHDGLYVTYLEYDSKEGKEKLIAREIDINNLKFVNQGKVLTSFSGKDGIAGRSYIYSYLNDSTQLAITTREHVYQAKIENITVHIYGEELNEVSNYTSEITNSKIIWGVKNTTVDDSGNAYFLTLIKDAENEYHRELAVVSHEGDVLTVETIDGENSFVNFANFYRNSKGDLFLAGSYGHVRGHTTGGFISEISRDAKLGSISLIEFPESILTQSMTEKELTNHLKATKNGDVSKLILSKLLFLNDGSIIFCGEVEFDYTFGTGKDPMLDLFVFSIDQNGKLNWIKKLPKKQSQLKYDLSTGAFTFSTTDHVYFFFYDTPDNDNMDLTGVPEKFDGNAKGSLNAYKVNYKSGEAERLLVASQADREEMNIDEIPLERMIKISETEFAARCSRKKDDVVVKFTIQE